MKIRKNILLSKCLERPLSLALILNEDDARAAKNNAKKISSSGV